MLVIPLPLGSRPFHQTEPLIDILLPETLGGNCSGLVKRRLFPLLSFHSETALEARVTVVNPRHPPKSGVRSSGEKVFP